MSVTNHNMKIFSDDMTFKHIFSILFYTRYYYYYENA